MKQSISPTFIGLYAAYLTVVTYLFPADSNLVRDPLQLFARVLVLLVPFLCLYVFLSWGSVKKWMRILGFRITRIHTLARLAATFFTLMLVYFISVEGFEHILADLSLLYIAALNWFFAVFSLLLNVAKIKIRQAPALLIRNFDLGDEKIYLYQKGVIRHIPDPDTLLLLGYSFVDVVNIPQDEFDAYNKRSDIESVRTATFVRDQNDIVWYTTHDEKKRVPDQITLRYIRKLTRKDPQRDDGHLQKLRDSGELTSIVNIIPSK